MGSGDQAKDDKTSALYAAALAGDNDGTITAYGFAETAKSGSRDLDPNPSAVIFKPWRDSRRNRLLVGRAAVVGGTPEMPETYAAQRKL